MNICCNFLPHTNAPSGKESGTTESGATESGKESGTTTESIRRDGVGHVVEGLRVQQELEDLQHHLGGQQGGVVLGHHHGLRRDGVLQLDDRRIGDDGDRRIGIHGERASDQGRQGVRHGGVINAREKRSARAA